MTSNRDETGRMLSWILLLMVCGKVHCLLLMAKRILTLLTMAVMNTGYLCFKYCLNITHTFLC